ncbi:penicillin-binding protein 1C [Ahniella affigens]|uniref:peptidoglycan glycosyltransferase n=1 Tax=Ahniella affigens TaxID=2021234 RepID=A0A2P1PT94_9GAMM|nr:penicillin-binding protein 1C [Ahniella affigens]AVP98058.1 penicillin-binding protein 1C [Ahniella affigens]
MPARVRQWLKNHPRWTCLLGLMLLVILLDRCFPPPIPNLNQDAATVVLARDGTPLRAFANAEGVWRYPVSLNEVSPRYLEALRGYEDRWFDYHPGFNPLAFARALMQAVWHGEIVSGGSTLTMQVARMIEPIPHSGVGKIRQVIRALQLELRLSKSEILTLYVNLAPFGGGIEGVQAASYAYLGKPASQLSHSEAALLAVLPQSPSRNRPDRHPERARAARDKVLNRLAEFGDWPSGVIAEARDEPVVARSLRPPMLAALLAERLKREHPDSRRLHSTIDATLQRAMETQLAQYMQRLPEKTSAAVLVLDHRNLETLVYIGSAQYGDELRLGHIDMVQARRSPGSTLKPFLYGMALDAGLIHSESLLLDVPQDFDGYRPGNFGDDFNGPIAASEALRLSLNVPAVDLLDRVGPQRFSARLAHAGVDLNLPLAAKPNLSIILGGTATQLEQLVGAYAALASGGMAGSIRLLQTDPESRRQLLTPGAAFIVRNMLADHGRPGDPGALIDTSRRKQIAWKTGTSYGFRDAWAIGVTPEHVIGVWIGRPDGTPVPDQYGAATALPLLIDLSERLPGQARFTDVRPASVQLATICWPAGTLATDNADGSCRKKREAMLLDNLAPPTLLDRASKASDALTVNYQVDTKSGLRVSPGCSDQPSLTLTKTRWPVLAEPWIGQVERDYNRLPAFAPGCQSESLSPSDSLRIEGLVNHSVLRKAPGSDEPVRARLRAIGASGRVDWLLDGRWLAEQGPAQSFDLSFTRTGTQTITALDEQGRFGQIEVRVE